MNSYQNIALLENLYRLKSLGFSYVDPINPNKIQTQSLSLPNSNEELTEAIKGCHLCDLSKSRRQSMPGYGSLHPKIVFLDAFVSSAEDESNGYYVGRLGSMLRDMIEKVLHLTIEDVTITHAVKCKPFGFQQPSPSECNSCSPFLHKQLDILAPSLIVTLGSEAYRLLTHDESDFERVRGHIIPFGNSSIIPIYHPAYLVRNPSCKKETMRDLLTIKEALK
ncbi:MAG: uracil-DNA glycosylase [Sulfuricurvum sp.]